MTTAVFIGGPNAGEKQVSDPPPRRLQFTEPCGCSLSDYQRLYPDGCGCPTVLHEYVAWHQFEDGRIEYRYQGEERLIH